MEISLAFIGWLSLKLMWSSVALGLLAVFFLWPVGDKPVTTYQKSAFAVVSILALLCIFEVIKVVS